MTEPHRPDYAARSRLYANPEHLATLYEITRTLNSSLELNVVLENVMDRVIEVTGAERGFLMLHNDATGELEFQGRARDAIAATWNRPSFRSAPPIIKHVSSKRACRC